MHCITVFREQLSQRMELLLSSGHSRESKHVLYFMWALVSCRTKPGKLICTSVLRTTGMCLIAVTGHMAQHSAFKYISCIIFLRSHTSVLRTTGHLIDGFHWAQGAVDSIQLCQSLCNYKKPVFWELLGIWLTAVTEHKAQQPAFSYFSHFIIIRTSVLRTTEHMIDSCHWAQGAAVSNFMAIYKSARGVMVDYRVLRTTVL